jgi:mannosylfructose-phosphate synthase
MLSTHGYVDPVPQLGRTDTGGQVVYVLQLAKAFAKQGTKVDIYTRWFDGSKKQIDPVPEYPDVNVIRIPAGPQKFIAKEEIYDVLPELTENMIDFVKTNGYQYDFFHGHYVDAGIVTLDVAEAFNKPSFFTAHSLGAWKRDQMGGDPVKMEKKYNFNHRIKEELRIFKSVRAQTVTTKLQREKLKELYGFVSDNVVVISPGVDVHTFCPPKTAARPVDTKLPERYIFCLSRIDSNKGHDLLLKAFDLVRKKIDDVHLVIGGGSPQPRQVEQQVFDSMKKIIDELSMHEKVHVIGYVPDELLVPSYQHAELFVLPSIFEPFGMTALEAMACGRPVVASKFGGIKNVIHSGENGVLIDPADQKEFAEAMIKLLNAPKSAEGMGLKGRETIQKSYSWEAIADKHFAFYDRFNS